jgi:hypothetical protein
VFALVLVAYGLTSSPVIGWLDAPELAAASVSLGVAQSPGHPLVLLAGKLCSFLPLGDLAFRVNLASSLAGAGAASCLYAAARVALEPVAPRSRAAIAALAAGLALIAGFSAAFWASGVRAEVYALEALLAVAALGCALAYRRARQPRHLMLFALLAAMAASNHPAIAAGVLIPATALVLWSRPSARSLSTAAVCAVLGLASIAYLPVRAAQHPVPNFGAPSTAGRVAWTLSGQAFHKTASAEHTSGVGIDALQATASVLESITAPLIVLALVGIAAGLRRREMRGTTATLLGVAVLAVAIRAVLGFDPETPDHHAYLMGGIAAAALLAGIGAASIAAWVESRAQPSALALPFAAFAVLAVAPVQLSTNWERSSLAGAVGADVMARYKIEDPPPRALLLSAYFETAFQLDALRALEGARPDMAILDRSFLTYPGAAAEAAHHHPELAALIDAPLRAGAPSPIAVLDELARERPVVVELHPNVDPALEQRLVPTGPFAAYMPRADQASRPRLLEAAEHRERRLDAFLASRMRGESAADAERASLALAWRYYLLAEHYCRRGRREAAQLAFDRARERAPADRTLAELAAGCSLVDGAPR